MLYFIFTFLAHDVFFVLIGLFMIGGDTLICIFFLFHIAYCFIFMRLFMIYVFILCYVKSRSYLCFTCIFHTCVYAFVECFGKYTS